MPLLLLNCSALLSLDNVMSNAVRARKRMNVTQNVFDCVWVNVLLHIFGNQCERTILGYRAHWYKWNEWEDEGRGWGSNGWTKVLEFIYVHTYQIEFWALEQPSELLVSVVCIREWVKESEREREKVREALRKNSQAKCNEGQRKYIGASATERAKNNKRTHKVVCVWVCDGNQ